jgi:hypothetical protein
MPFHNNKDFPYQEIKTKDGDYFSTVQEAKDLGFKVKQIWSVAVVDDEDENGKEFTSYCYQPPCHIVNVIGYVATKEAHDHDTYFEEPRIYMDN